jgi:HTH-type transcriptional regulator/antitoxin HigA
MSNYDQYGDISAFHPGFYIAELIEDMGISQEEFARRMGTSAKTVSKLVNGEVNLSKNLASKLSSMMGTSIDLWLNLQLNYDKKIWEMERIQELHAQEAIARQIDYSYFVKHRLLPKASSILEKTANLCAYLKISNLNYLTEPQAGANFRMGVPAFELKNIIAAQVWLQTAINVSESLENVAFNATLLRKTLPEIRGLTLSPPGEFMPKLTELLRSAGVSFVLLPYLKNSAIHGVVKWNGPNQVLLAMNDRRKYLDTFWFSLFHEIQHVMQQKIKKVIFDGDNKGLISVDRNMEEEADQFARDFLISPMDYAVFCRAGQFSEKDILAFSQDIHIHPGIVVGRLQTDKLILRSSCNHLREKWSVEDFSSLMLSSMDASVTR